ncbi:elongation factor P [Candidatus Azambacteria bacterium RIFCSPHIGHO2_01_46_10]|uniref:Elongation factor P n=9 Tax=Candidatus Azamiibacteriota TaxID=1752741 RepID=A0A1F5C7C4_9BACT|nr:MAG: Elongation factor P [Candidatus Azambacteria bacterium GW2011_GWA2_45_90]KKU22999.1 MAG: Elongation factor P [Candidatus Azambacteria bacterium GW2011_GWC1_46_13]KKU34400.1 MAG: Elongation factor P [Candidatus Azambacteria bacterium GW2011_GWB1_46_27]KKU38037.1 MAG: Elongation factor P [Candidatus Azambacteria bacterium GW2011_GWF2_46_32]KKU39241.1 MAG: Elongation factor P [Candidatus Azambacteria bacterium GW2011_GWB2_46_37]KKU39415.1 MAG: Elongation factor P [Candidatus Azambacteria 
MLSYNELKPGTYIVMDGQPYVVLEFQFLRMQQRKPVAQTKIKNLINGKIVERTFHQNDKLEEAEITRSQVKYLYNSRGQYFFCEPENPQNRFTLTQDQLDESVKFFKPNTLVDAVSFQDKIINISLPIKIDLKIAEAPPGIKGDTAQGGSKTVILETGAQISVPLFINAGDVVKINTETGEYVERVEKAKM